jgi:hypothetical protein
MPRRIVRQDALTDVDDIAASKDTSTQASASTTLRKRHLICWSGCRAQVRDSILPLLRSPTYASGRSSGRNYLVLYRPLPDGVEILRVIHGARDIPALFGLRKP